MTADVNVTRNRRNIRAKAHRLSGSEDVGACGRVVHDPEVVPLSQTDPWDRCRFCFPPDDTYKELA